MAAGKCSLPPEMQYNSCYKTVLMVLLLLSVCSIRICTQRNEYYHASAQNDKAKGNEYKEEMI